MKENYDVARKLIEKSLEQARENNGKNLILYHVRFWGVVPHKRKGNKQTSVRYENTLFSVTLNQFSQLQKKLLMDVDNDILGYVEIIPNENPDPDLGYVPEKRLEKLITNIREIIPNTSLDKGYVLGTPNVENILIDGNPVINVIGILNPLFLIEHKVLNTYFYNF